MNLAAGEGTVFTDHGDAVDLAIALRLAEQAEVIGIRFDTTGAVLALGRCRRLATPAQRRALTLRDGGCTFPGCTTPASWCEANHVTAWADGGPTDLDNLCLVCPHHHRVFGGLGWVVRMRDGVPEWTPPAWIDLHRRPRRNTIRQLERYDFDEAIRAVTLISRR